MCPPNVTAMRRALLAVLTALVLVGCSSVGSDSGGMTEAMSPARAGEDMAAADGAAGFEADAVAAEDRDLIVEGSVEVTVDDPRGAAQAAVLLVERVGGRISERSEQAATEHSDASARMVARVPAAEVTAFIDRLGDLGTVDSVETTSTDVTMQTRDLDARVRAMELSIERLEQFMTEATNTEDLLSAERTLTERQAELESMQSQRTRLADRVDLSTLTVHFWTEGQTPVEAAGGFTGGLQAGWAALMTTLATALLVVGVLVPWLALAGLVVLAVVAVRRRMTRRGSRPTTPAPQPAATPPAPTADSSPV